MRLIERLPDHAHYKTAIHDDDSLADELAARHAAHQEDDETATSRVRVDARTWTPERAALADVADILLAIRASLEAQRTGTAQKPPRMPRPVLAAQRREHAESYRRHQDRVRRLLPTQSDPEEG